MKQKKIVKFVFNKRFLGANSLQFKDFHEIYEFEKKNNKTKNVCFKGDFIFCLYFYIY